MFSYSLLKYIAGVLYSINHIQIKHSIGANRSVHASLSVCERLCVHAPMNKRVWTGAVGHAIPKEGALQTRTIKHKICITKHGWAIRSNVLSCLTVTIALPLALSIESHCYARVNAVVARSPISFS